MLVSSRRSKVPSISDIFEIYVEILRKTGFLFMLKRQAKAYGWIQIVMKDHLFVFSFDILQNIQQRILFGSWRLWTHDLRNRIKVENKSGIGHCRWETNTFFWWPNAPETFIEVFYWAWKTFAIHRHTAAMNMGDMRVF